MTCDEVRDVLALVAVGDDEPVDPEVAAHLALCGACAAAGRTYLATTGRLLDAVAPISPPEGLRSRILERAFRERPGAAEGAQAGGAVDPPHTREGTAAWDPKVPATSVERRTRRFGWAAAIILAVLNVALIWDGRTARNELAEVGSGLQELWAELDETLSAFSGAPAVFAGSLDFQLGEAVRTEVASAQGYVYARPNGWAVLFRIEGLAHAGGRTFDVWLDTGSGWERYGAVRVRPDGALAWIYYAREPEVSLRRVYVAGGGAMPGTREWVTQAVASARVVGAAGPGSAPAPEGGAW